jgi:flavin reductase (DIM6/NTAB) family NADH-FMN oxidoreductase RutF
MSHTPAPAHREPDRALRAAFSQFATGVTIVTAIDAQGQPIGLTVSSFSSVSLAPPLVLWSLSHGSHSLEAFRQCSHYAIHVLSAQQMELAQRFATRGVDRFAGLACQAGLGNAPLLADALATFECRNHRQHPEGDHTIFVGEVLRCTHRADAPALLYHRSTLMAAPHIALEQA